MGVIQYFPKADGIYLERTGHIISRHVSYLFLTSLSPGPHELVGRTTSFNFPLQA